MSAPNCEIIYAGMSDDEILHIACEASDLREEARGTLNGELRKRKLTEKDISEYREQLALIRRGEMAANQNYVARSFLGVGTTIYGKRDFHSDGSYYNDKTGITILGPDISARECRDRKGDSRVCDGQPWFVRALHQPFLYVDVEVLGVLQRATRQETGSVCLRLRSRVVFEGKES